MVNKSESMKTLKNARKCLRQCGHPRDDLELIAAKVPILRFHRDGVQVGYYYINWLKILRNKVRVLLELTILYGLAHKVFLCNFRSICYPIQAVQDFLNLLS